MADSIVPGRKIAADMVRRIDTLCDPALLGDIKTAVDGYRARRLILSESEQRQKTFRELAESIRTDIAATATAAPGAP